MQLLASIREVYPSMLADHFSRNPSVVVPSSAQPDYVHIIIIIIIIKTHLNNFSHVAQA